MAKTILGSMLATDLSAREVRMLRECHTNLGMIETDLSAREVRM